MWRQAATWAQAAANRGGAPCSRARPPRRPSACLAPWGPGPGWPTRTTHPSRAWTGSAAPPPRRPSAEPRRAQGLGLGPQEGRGPETRTQQMPSTCANWLCRGSMFACGRRPAPAHARSAEGAHLKRGRGRALVAASLAASRASSAACSPAAYASVAPNPTSVNMTFKPLQPTGQPPLACLTLPVCVEPCESCTTPRRDAPCAWLFQSP